MPNIEDQLRKAIEEGKFDNLPGKGKPIRWDENPFAGSDWQLAFHMLREAGFALPWMETHKEIETQLEAARASLKRAWDWKESATFVEDEWQQALRTFRGQITEINHRIFGYNLEVPLPRFQRRPVDAQAEIAQVARSYPAESQGE